MIYEWQPHEQCKYFLGSIQTQRTEAWHKYALSTHSNCVYCGWGGLKVIVGVGCAFGQWTHKKTVFSRSDCPFIDFWLELFDSTHTIVWLRRLWRNFLIWYRRKSGNIRIISRTTMIWCAEKKKRQREKGWNWNEMVGLCPELGCCGEIYVKMLATLCSARGLLKPRLPLLCLLRVSF